MKNRNPFEKPLELAFARIGLKLRMRLSCLGEIKQSMMSWGTHATVIAPVELRTRLLRITENLCQRYGKDDLAACA